MKVDTADGIPLRTPMAGKGRKPGRMRLDDLLVERGVAESKAQAQGLIRAGKVREPSRVLDKPGREVPTDLAFSIAESSRYVGRGAEKLAGYLKRFPLPVAGAHFLDVGASTGGFTDYLLQHGAASATCVDVGHGQLHYKLRTDSRVTNLERLNARYLTADQLDRTAFHLIVMDLSFISLTKVLPAIWPLLLDDGHLIALVKPQFEAGKAEVDAGQGVIRDAGVRARVLEEILGWVRENLPGAALIGTCESPLHGADGNLEYLAGWKKVATAPAGPQVAPKA